MSNAFASRTHIGGLGLVLSLAGGPAAAAAPTLDELVARNVEAHGGTAALHAMTSLRLSGKLLVNDGQFTLQFVQTVARAGGVRQDASVQGLTQVQAWDGKEGWQIDPFQGRKDPERLPGDTAKNLAEIATDFDGPLVDWRAKGFTLEYLGTEDVDGTQAHKIRLTRPNGDGEILWLDPEHFLEIRQLVQRTEQGVKVEVVTDFGDYERVAGVWLPMAMEFGRKGSTERQKFIVRVAEVNVAADAAMFRFPVVGAAAASPAAAAPKPPASAPAPAPLPAPAPVPARIAPATAAVAPPFSSSTISGLGARNIGSAVMSGRIAAIAGVKEPSGRTTLYVGAASGGVWKSDDGGTRYRPVFDDQPVQSIGAIALDPSNPRTLWVGTGEAWTRNSVSIGDGIYRSTDGGDTWAQRGLPASERIARIVVSPRDGATVYACVAGALWSDSAERGLYKTTDAGATWQLVLRGANLSTGCSGLSMDPKNPEVLFAAMWDFRRQGWTFRSGGESPSAPSGSGLFRSADGGATWTEVTPAANAGFAKKPYGRLAVAVAPSDPQRVYAFVESTDSALYVSDDGGATWSARDKSQWMVWRPFYFANLIVDPTNKDRLFKTNGALIESTDGGNSFSAVGGFVGMHGDVHDVWIDPSNPQTVVGGDDGGLYTSYDGGHKWWKGNNLPVSQFYHVSVDDAPAYRVYGGLQDNGTWVAPSSFPGGIASAQWENVYGSDGFWAWADPTHPDYLYAEGQGGDIGRVNRLTHETRRIQPLLGPAETKLTSKLRFNWNTPIALSPTDKRTLYIGSQFLWRSRDQGRSWQRISPDLTTNDPAHQKQEQSGGVTVDNSAAEMYETIFAISESPKDAKTIWAGTDDGRLQITRDDGRHWTDVISHVPGLPAGAWVNGVQASPHAAGTAFAVFDRHTVGDMAPYAYRTTDYGRNWTPLVTPADPKGVRGYAHVIRQDPVVPGLLYLGTEFGLWVSIDGGAQWARFKGGQLPPVAVRDLALQPRTNDLVLATHGRGIWIVDDITPWRMLARAQQPGATPLLAQDLALIPTGAAMQHLRADGGWALGDAEFVGANPSSGALITYFQRARHLFGRMTIEVLDAKGQRVAALPASKKPGLNRVLWNMQEKPPRVPPAAQLAGAGTTGPRVLPGSYIVRITKGAQKAEMPLKVVLDPQASFTLDDRRAQHAAAGRMRKLFGEETDLTRRVVALRASIAERLAELAPADLLRVSLAALDAKADALRKQIVATTEGGAITGEERLREHTDLLYGAIVFHEGKPTAYQMGNLGVLEEESKRIDKAFEALVAADLAAWNRAATAAGKKAVAVPPKEPEEDDEEDAAGGGGDSYEGGIDPDALMGASKVPTKFRPMR